MRGEENSELRRDIEALKIYDSNKMATIDFDAYLTRLLTTYRVLVNRAKQYVINAFNACDLDGNRKCNFHEWCMLNRHIEPTKFDDDQLESVFEDSADIVDNGEKNLSFDRFAVLSLEHELFSDEAQDRYLNISHPAQLRELYEKTLANWTMQGTKERIRGRFAALRNIDQHEIDEWLNNIDVLDTKLTSTPFSIAHSKPLLIAFFILDKESTLLEQDSLSSTIQQQTEVNL